MSLAVPTPQSGEYDELAPVDALELEGADKSVLGRGLSILDTLSRAGHPLTLTELTRLTRLPKSTLHRLVSQFIQLGLLDRTDEGVALGLRLFEWGSHAERQRHLKMAAIPFLTELHGRLGETVHLAVLDGQDVVYIEKIEARKAVRCPTYVGDRKPAHATALGKAMLAFMPDSALKASLSQPLEFATHRTVVTPDILGRQIMRVRESGVSIEVEESVLGLACVAAPIRDARGTVLGAVSISVPTFRFDPRKLEPEMLRVSKLISQQLESLHPSNPF